MLHLSRGIVDVFDGAARWSHDGAVPLLDDAGTVPQTAPWLALSVSGPKIGITTDQGTLSRVARHDPAAVKPALARLW
jgi:hypothetical protein